MTSTSGTPPAPMDDHARERPEPAPVLPPVEPPSAGFIIQLFVVPALIVAAVIGVYLLFGRLAATDADWRELVVDLRSSNSHTRWRGAYGLAQLLEADSLRRPAAGAPEAAMTPMVRDPELAQELAVTLQEQLAREDSGEDHQRLLEYLVKCLGWMDVPDVAIPALQSAFRETRAAWLRQQSLIAIGMIAARAHEQGQPVEDPDLTRLLIGLTETETGVLRHLAAFHLGFLADAEAAEQLQSLLNDADAMTRVNAAVGVARSDSMSALPIFRDMLQTAAQQTFDPQTVRDQAAADEYFQRAMLALNALTYVRDNATILDAAQRDELRPAVTVLEASPDAKIRHLAIEALHALDEAARP